MDPLCVFCDRCQLLDLPWEDVLVTHVFCYLPLRHLVSLQCVSKSFLSLVQVYLANCRKFDPAQTGPHIPKEAFCSMLRHNQVLHHLCVSNCSDWITDKELLPVIGQSQHLLRVDMRGCVHLSRHALVAVSLSCSRLQHLILAHCEWVDNVWCMLRPKPRALIEMINVEQHFLQTKLFNNFCLSVFRTLAEYCPKLQSLKVNHCHNVTESSLGVLRRRNVEIDVEPPLQRALVLLQDVVGFAPFINLQI
uniref:F-box and leucine-rich repeat protein 15 n=1 Tax=Cyprinus carpio TaxID=7962 RepID=A0A8C1VR03_CYPCA